jgi:hypothetical protein
MHVGKIKIWMTSFVFQVEKGLADIGIGKRAAADFFMTAMGSDAKRAEMQVIRTGKANHLGAHDIAHTRNSLASLETLALRALNQAWQCFQSFWSVVWTRNSNSALFPFISLRLFRVCVGALPLPPPSPPLILHESGLSSLPVS